VVTGQVRACDTGVAGAGAHHDEIAAMPLAGVVADRVRRYLRRLTARQPAVPGRPVAACQQVRADRGQHPARLDRGIPAAAQSPGELAAQGRVDLASRGCVEKLEAADRRVRPRGRLLQQLQLGLVGGQRQRPVRPETGARHLDGQLLPACPGPQGQAQLGPGGAAADPDQAEVADAGAARLRLPLEVQHVEPAPPSRRGVHRAEHPAADHHNTFHGLAPSRRW
jgi:hypothetical protein